MSNETWEFSIKKSALHYTGSNGTIATAGVISPLFFFSPNHCHVKLTTCNNITWQIICFYRERVSCFSYIFLAIDVFLLLLAKGDVFISCRLLSTAEWSNRKSVITWGHCSGYFGYHYHHFINTEPPRCPSPVYKAHLHIYALWHVFAAAVKKFLYKPSI